MGKLLATEGVHVAHIQFNSYAGELGKPPKSASRELTDYVNSHENMTCDGGQAMFGHSYVVDIADVSDNISFGESIKEKVGKC